METSAILALKQQIYEQQRVVESHSTTLAQLRQDLSDLERSMKDMQPFVRDNNIIECTAMWIISSYEEGSPLNAKTLAEESGCSEARARKLKLTQEMKDAVKVLVQSICSGIEVKGDSVQDVVSAVIDITSCTVFGELSPKINALHRLVDSLNKSILYTKAERDAHSTQVETVRRYCDTILDWKEEYSALAALTFKEHTLGKVSTLKVRCEALGIDYIACKQWLSRNKKEWEKALLFVGAK